MFVGIGFIFLWICVTCLSSTWAAPAPAKGPQLYVNIMDIAPFSQISSQQLEGLAEGRADKAIKRGLSILTHIGEVLTSVVSKASSEIQNKDRLVAQASFLSFLPAFISPASSKTNHSEGHHGINEPQHGNWTFKESVMHSLIKAVNVITGGVTILKGELIKGGGALAITLGKVIEVEGEAESNCGKKIISSTTLGDNQNRSVVHPAMMHVKYEPPSTYGAPAAPTPSVTKAYGSHRYPSQIDGRKKRIGFHADFFLPSSKSPDTENIAHTPLDPPFRTVDWWK